MTVTFERAPAPEQRRGSPRNTQRSRGASPMSPAPRPGIVDAAVVVLGLGLGATVAVTLTSETSAGLHAPGGVAMFLGNLTGLVGTYLALVMVLLVSRIPVVERALGQDGLVRLHRRLSPWPITLIVAHAALLTYAYATVTKHGLLGQIGSFISGYSGMFVATVGFVLLVVASALSIYSVRRRLRRETWWAIHLGMYLAFSLAFLHEIVLGPAFVGHPLTVALWSGAWAATAGVVLAYRFGLPILRSLRHDLRVVEVRPEADGVASIILKGRQLERLAVSGGQFFEWRFLTRGMWWQAHPYSVSARPRPPHMRLTVKAVGDHSTALASIAVGTRVAIEGPYGAFTAHAQRRKKVALIAGGIGITAIRSLLEDLQKRSEPVVVWRLTSSEDAALESEVRELVSHLHGRLYVIPGSRDAVPIERVVEPIGDLRQRDVYVAGSHGFVQAMHGVLDARRVPKEAVHYEEYAL